jgi:hypothetical protein
MVRSKIEDEGIGIDTSTRYDLNVTYRQSKKSAISDGLKNQEDEKKRYQSRDDGRKSSPELYIWSEASILGCMRWRLGSSRVWH